MKSSLNPKAARISTTKPPRRCSSLCWSARSTTFALRPVPELLERRYDKFRRMGQLAGAVSG